VPTRTHDDDGSATTPPSFHVTSHTCWVRRPDRIRVPVPVPEPVVLVWQEVAVAQQKHTGNVRSRRLPAVRPDLPLVSERPWS